MHKKEIEEYDLIIMGGGPSGMMMSIIAARGGARVLLLEKNNELAKKLKLTGGGRCNITNKELDDKKFLENFGDSKKFLFSPFSKFSVKDTFSLFEKNGLPLVTEARNRVFPASQKATDVFKNLEKMMREYGVEIQLNQQVIQLKKVDSSNGKMEIASVKTRSGDSFFAKNFAIATGGASHPETGSTGDGFKFLGKLGHKIKKPNPNVVPLKTDSKILHEISGTSWSFCKISFIQEGKTKFSKTGKILFTHFGLSAPMILNSSYEVKTLLKDGPVLASVDLFPDTEEPDLDRKLWRLFEKNATKKLKNVLPKFLQKKLAEAILEHFPKELSQKAINELSKEERKSLVKKMKNLNMGITGTLGMDKAVVADGGLILKEVNFSNMTSKNYSNLYVLGDTLDINRPSGGYSLQLCWTTGFVAGQDVIDKLKKERKTEKK